MSNRNNRNNNGGKAKKRVPYNASSSKAGVDEARINNNGKRKFNESTGHKYNDVSWYSKNDQMLRDAASFSYNNPVGYPISLSDMVSGSRANVTLGAPDGAVPSVALLSIGICPGLSDKGRSPLNLAAQNIYSYVRYMNSGSKNYNEPDLMLYLMAMDSIYSMWNWLKRTYGLATTYSQYNWTLPDVLIKGNYCDPSLVRNNLAQFRARLNTMAARISSFCVPSVMPLFIRHSWMFSNVYRDSEVMKSQLYMFIPEYFYKYDETQPKGGKLVTLPLRATKDANPLTKGWDPLAWCDALEECIDALMRSEDIGVISGDILKAYGSSNLFKLTPVEPDYRVEPVYNLEVLTQIHNATSIGTDLYSDSQFKESFDITQDPDTNSLIWNPTLASSIVNFNGVVIDLPYTEVSPAQTMVATRLSCTVNYDTVAPYSGHVTACGSEVWCRGWIICYNTKLNTYTAFNMSDRNLLASPISTATWNEVGPSTILLIQNLWATANFDFHPLVKTFVAKPGQSALGTDLYFLGLFGDVQNYTYIDQEKLQQMHLTALLSEFNVPQLGSF